MIKNDFFATDITENYTGNKLTAQIQTLNLAGFSNAYWLGWIRPENISSIYHLSKFRITDDSYIFEDVTKMDRNYNVGYLSTYNEYLRNNSAMLYPTNPVTVATPSDYARYINKLDVLGVGIHNTFQIDFRIAINGTNIWRDMGFPIPTMRDLLRYLNGDTDITLTFQNQHYQTITKTFKLTDMTDGALLFEINGISYAATILGFHLGICQRSINENGNYGQYLSPTPCIDIETDEYTFISAPAIGPFTRSAFQTSFRWNNETWMDTNYKFGQLGDYDLFASGLSGEIPKTFISAANQFEIFGNMLVINDYSNYAFRITRIYTIDDIKKFLGLQIRIISNNISPYEGSFYGYALDTGDNVGVYAPLVTDDNEFTTDIITGVLSDTEFKSKLRDWQWNAEQWEENDYETPPPFEPGGDDSENVGDSVTLPSVFGVGTTNGFVTQYALRKSDIQQLGMLLWTSFVDADYWQNYLFSLALDTGTFSLAGLMSFFVSLKVYPFPLVNIQGLVSEGGNDMYVGTGIVPLHFTNKLHSLTSYVDKIEGGSVTVMSNYFFKDWRDYVNTEIILYVPYCGTIHLNPADVVGNEVSIRYVIDFSTGGCVAYVMCNAAGEKSFMIGALPGQIGADVPLSATAAGEIAARFIGDAMNAGHLVGGEVGSVASGIAGAAFGKNDNDHPILGGGSGSPFAGIAGVYGGLPGAMGADLAPGVASQALTMLTRSAVSAPLMSGGRGFASFGAPQIPYIQIRRGIYPEIAKLSEICGTPSAGSYKVGDLSGFVSGVVKTDGLSCPENEKAAIRKLIANGIYV